LIRQLWLLIPFRAEQTWGQAERLLCSCEAQKLINLPFVLPSPRKGFSKYPTLKSCALRLRSWRATNYPFSFSPPLLLTPAFLLAACQSFPLPRCPPLLTSEVWLKFPAHWQSSLDIVLTNKSAQLLFYWLTPSLYLFPYHPLSPFSHDPPHNEGSLETPQYQPVFQYGDISYLVLFAW